MTILGQFFFFYTNNFKREKKQIKPKSITKQKQANIKQQRQQFFAQNF